MPRLPNVSRQTTDVLRALLAMYPEWTYGYDLSRVTGLKSGTLYPILMRLAGQEYLERDWAPSAQQGRPPRQLYRLTGQGKELAQDRTSARVSARRVAALAET